MINIPRLLHMNNSHSRYIKKYRFTMQNLISNHSTVLLVYETITTSLVASLYISMVKGHYECKWHT